MHFGVFLMCFLMFLGVQKDKRHLPLRHLKPRRIFLHSGRKSPGRLRSLRRAFRLETPGENSVDRGRGRDQNLKKNTMDFFLRRVRFFLLLLLFRSFRKPQKAQKPLKSLLEFSFVTFSLSPSPYVARMHTMHVSRCHKMSHGMHRVTFASHSGTAAWPLGHQRRDQVTPWHCSSKARNCKELRTTNKFQVHTSWPCVSHGVAISSWKFPLVFFSRKNISLLWLDLTLPLTWLINVDNMEQVEEIQVGNKALKFSSGKIEKPRWSQAS